VIIGCSLDYLVIIGHLAGGWGRTVPLVGLAHPVFPSGTPDIGFLPVPVPLLHVVDANTQYLQRILYHNTFFHVSGGENPPPTAAGASVHAKEFVCTTLHAYKCPIQSESDEGDKIHPHNHNTHKHTHVSDHDEEFQRRFCDVERTDSETKWQHPHRGVYDNRIR
jgi:hypothetical protein